MELKFDQVINTEGMKFDGLKPRPDLIPAEFSRALPGLWSSPLDLDAFRASVSRGDEPLGSFCTVALIRNGMVYNRSRALLDVAGPLSVGAKKYKPHNWMFVSVDRYWRAAERHLLQHMAGERLDCESGLWHLDHMMCCLMFVWCIQKDILTPEGRPISAYEAEPT